MDQYAVIFVGTPYMDGKYTKIEGAYNAKESLGKKFPNSRLEIIQVSEKFKLTDDIFWANHKKYLHALDRATAKEVTHH